MLVLPTVHLRALLVRAYDPEKFSLLLTHAGSCFAARPLITPTRLAVLKNSTLLDTPRFAALDMRPSLNQWQQLAA